ncbi:MAG: N-acetylmuramoyl-L-alanine amidase [Flavobacteriales bacterium]|nr:N-acetylmuramoyl-L-alanine amidase [Flavobacteriales bacterium]MCB9448865.1 N-acetylmuramoyl-L-alanine amidase [Flavobacteriales bacterium]
MKKITCLLLLLAFAPVLTSFVPKGGEEGYKIRTVVIDPGHGGHDPGCSGVKAKEKDVALALALKLGKHIEEQYKDIKVIYTRKDDRFIELHRRAAIANENHADLFICIHLNSGPATAYGAETYVMGLHKSAANLEVAKRENASILLEEGYEEQYDGYDPKSPEGSTILELFQSAYLDQSLAFATRVQDNYRGKAKMKDRGIKQAGFLVLYKTTMPSVLIESGFLTNPSEEKFLTSEEGQSKIAEGLFTAFSSYKKELESRSPGTIVEQAPEDSTEGESSNMADHEIRVNGKPVNQGSTGEQPAVGESEAGIVFKVQIVSSANRIPMSDPSFQNLPDLKEYNEEGIFKYAAGKARTFTDATALQKDIRAKGFADAFVVAFRDGKKIPLKDALDAQGK